MGIYLPSQWVDQSTSSNDNLVACKLQHTDGQSVTVTRSVTVNGDFTWCVHVHGQALDSTKCNALNIFPVTITTKVALNQLLTLVDTLIICAVHPDQHFLDLADSRKGKFQSVSNNTVAFTDTTYPTSLNGEVYASTVRTTSCEILVHGPKCEACKKYRSTLRSFYSQWMQQRRLDTEKHTSVSSHTNYCYLRIPQRKERMSNLRAEVKTKRNEVERLKLKLKEATEKRGICVEKQLEDDLQTIMLEKTKEISEKYTENSFHRLFWDQQLEALKV